MDASPALRTLRWRAVLLLLLLPAAALGRDCPLNTTNGWRGFKGACLAGRGCALLLAVGVLSTIPKSRLACLQVEEHKSASFVEGLADDQMMTMMMTATDHTPRLVLLRFSPGDAKEHPQ